jgi:hypothetical protein
MIAQPQPSDTLMLAAAALAAINLVLILAGLAAPVLAFVLEFTGVTRKKVLFKRLAQHVQSMGIAMSYYISLLVALLLAFFYMKDPAGLIDMVSTRLVLVSLGALGAWLLFTWSYGGTWRGLKQQPWVHLGLGALDCLSSVTLTGVWLLTSYLALTLPWKMFAGLTLEQIPPPPAGSIIWPVLGALFGLGLVAASSLALQFVISRRNKDDFGRDYYKFALSTTAVVAIVALAVHLILHGVLVWFAVPVQSIDPTSTLAIIWYVTLGLLIPCLLIWILVARSSAPMRLRWTVYPATLFLCAHATGVVYLGLLLFLEQLGA